MDSTAINAVEDWAELGLDRSAAAMLLVQSDEPPEYAAQEIAIIEDLCTQCDASTIMTTSDPDEGEAFVRARRIAIPAVEQTGTLLLEDVGVPIPQLGALVLGIESIARANRVTISVIAHAGDGNTHPLIVFDPADADHERRARTAYGEIIDLALTLGGTITGEHGVGRLKRPWLADYLGTDAMALNQRIKDALDPDRILNPGAIF
jgi:glycolate oxidase